MFIIIGVLFLFMVCILTWFYIPYSPVKSEFQKDISNLKNEIPLCKAEEVFKSEEFSHLPNRRQDG